MAASFSNSSRFSTSTSAYEVLSEAITGNGISVSDIVSTTGELPNIAPERLKFVNHIGRGTSFQVSREEYHKRGTAPYYVAVKRFLVTSESQNEPLSRRYAYFLREVTALLHPPIRTHGCIAQVIACGWNDSPNKTLQPYLVMDYSDHGTLNEYLRRCKIPPNERRELALDVASGLRFLHECSIVHGDVKLDNVLIYDNNDLGSTDIIRPQVAKLSDFSGARFRHDFQDKPDIEYAGTTKYLAPETGIFGDNAFSKEPPSLLLYAKTDIYSLGLLIWETMSNGRSYIDRMQLLSRETEKEYLERLFATDVDAVRNLALSYFESTEAVTTDSVLDIAVREATVMCLFGNPHLRKDSSNVLKTLAEGTKEERHRHSTSRNTVNPIGTSMSGLRPITSRPGATQLPDTTYTLMPATSGNFIVRPAIKPPPVVTKTSTTIPLMEVDGDSTLSRNEFDVFKASQLLSMPWAAQKDIAHQMEVAATSKHQGERAHSHLQLAAMYHIGFGVEQHEATSLEHLRSACQENPSEEHIFLPVMKYLEQELGVLPDPDSKTEGIHSMHQDPYIPRRMILVENDMRRSLSTQLKEMSLLDAETYACQGALPKEDIWEALTAACREGRADDAIMISKVCHWQSAKDRIEPNFCHWLINLDYATVQCIFGNLSVDRDEVDSAMLSCLNQGIDSPLYIAEHHTELFGTPLHWAVHAGNVELVSLFISHGASVNITYENRMIRWSEPASRRYQPSPTPLDLAVQYHFANIVLVLVEAGGKVTGSHHRQGENSASHIIGAEVMPFARLFVHGEHARSSVQKTIHVLQSSGQDMNAVDNDGETPLTIAVRNPGTESYIVECLLDAAARFSPQFTARHGNIVLRSACLSDGSRASKFNTDLVLPLVDDLNKLGPAGLNALHYCAIFDAVGIARVLLGTTSIDVNKKCENGQTPLTYAALSGSGNIVEPLVVNEANIDLVNGSGASPLEIAVSARHTNVADALIQHGASLWFNDDSNVLHLAVTNRSQRGSNAKQLLERFPSELSVPNILNAFNECSWTPLHNAAYFGDFDGVEALINAGADPWAQRLPPRVTYAGTPLDLVTKITIKVGKCGKLGQDHAPVEKEGHLAVKRFKDRLNEIKALLEVRMSR